MKHEKDFGMIFQYFKKAGKPIGIMVAVRYKSHLTFGFSLCHKNDTFNKQIGFELAFKSLFADTPICPSMLKCGRKFRERAVAYFPNVVLVESFHEQQRDTIAGYYWKQVTTDVLGVAFGKVFEKALVANVMIKHTSEPTYHTRKTEEHPLNNRNGGYTDDIAKDPFFIALCQKYGVSDQGKELVIGVFKVFGKNK